MSWQFMNAPVKGSSNDGIKCEVSDVYPGEVRVMNSEGYTVAHISTQTEQGMLNDIAWVLMKMRDAGFEQGRKHVRDALGI